MCGICGVHIFDPSRVPDLEQLIEGIKLEKGKNDIIVPPEINGRSLMDKNASASAFVYSLLILLQHRGYHSSGIASSDGTAINMHKKLGYVHNVFDHESLEALAGHISIGHNRYATTGLPLVQNVQPFSSGNYALAHNGNIVNQTEARKEIEFMRHMRHAFNLQSTTDSELILYMVLNYWDSNLGIAENIGSVLENFAVGSYSLSMLAHNNLVGVKDPRGYWPLHMARVGGMLVLASEQQAIEKLVGFSGFKGEVEVREVESGEIVLSEEEGEWLSYKGAITPKQSQRCALDYAYLMSPDEPKLQRFRYACGELLGKDFNCKKEGVDYVLGIPNSGMIPAKGFSYASGVDCKEGVIKVNPGYIGRQFMKEEFSEEKFVYDGAELEGRRIVIVDDSIIKANTLDTLLRRIREKGVEEAHIRIIFPPFITGCLLGIHANKDELIASKLNLHEIEYYFMARFFGVDYKRDDLVGKIKDAHFDIKGLVDESVKRNMNFLTEGQRGRVHESRFSLKYLTREQRDKAYAAIGINPRDICNACVLPNASGYTQEMKEYIIGRV